MRIPWWKFSERRSGDPNDTRRDADPVAQLDARLRELGVTDGDARALAHHLLPALQARPAGDRDAFVEGVSAAWHASSETRAHLDRTASDIKEVERLMGAFTGELSKLDEVLEVLAAYVRRMRSSKAETSEGQTLH